MDPFKTNINCCDKNNMSANTQILKITNPMTDYDENEKNNVSRYTYFNKLNFY